MTDRILDGTNRMCNGCPQDGDPKFVEGCEGICNKVECFVHFLHDRGLICIPNARFGVELVTELCTILEKAPRRKK